MTLETALYLVNRDGSPHRCAGENLSEKLQDGDSILVSRVVDGTRQNFNCTYDSSDRWSTLRDDDLILAWDENQNKHVKAENFKTLFGDSEITLGNAILSANGNGSLSDCKVGVVRYLFVTNLDYGKELYEYEWIVPSNFEWFYGSSPDIIKLNPVRAGAGNIRLKVTAGSGYVLTDYPDGHTLTEPFVVAR